MTPKLRQRRRSWQKGGAIVQQQQLGKGSCRSSTEEVRTLVEGVAHHLGTPLNIVLGRAEMIVTGEVKEQELTESAEAIRVKAQEMRQVIDALLALGRHHELRLSSVSVKDLFHHTGVMMRQALDSAGVELEASLESSLPEEVLLDPARFQLALTNVLQNGIDALSTRTNKQLELLVGLERHTDQTTTMAFRVFDSGVGIRAELLPHIFAPFFTTKPIGKGLGLGLAIADAIVSDHGGWIQVESEAEQGSTFTLHLPLEVET
jgi:two-component system, NtrC family, sensor kinase